MSKLHFSIRICPSKTLHGHKQRAMTQHAIVSASNIIELQYAVKACAAKVFVSPGTSITVRPVIPHQSDEAAPQRKSWFDVYDCEEGAKDQLPLSCNYIDDHPIIVHYPNHSVVYDLKKPDDGVYYV